MERIQRYIPLIQAAALVGAELSFGAYFLHRQSLLYIISASSMIQWLSARASSMIQDGGGLFERETFLGRFYGTPLLGNPRCKSAHAIGKNLCNWIHTLLVGLFEARYIPLVRTGYHITTRVIFPRLEARRAFVKKLTQYDKQAATGIWLIC